MNLANPTEGAETLGIFSDLPSETTEAETQQSDQTATSEEAAKTHHDGKETQQAEKADGDTEAQSRRVKVKLDGREIELNVVTDDIDLDLIPKGMLMDADYRQKIMKHSENVKAFEESKSKYDSSLAELYDLIEFEAKQLNDSDLKDIDPDEFERKRLDLEKKALKFKEYREQRDNELLSNHKRLAEEERERLPELIPEWLDSSVMREDTQKISNMLIDTYGFTSEEISSIIDAKHISILRKAALYDEIQQASLESNRKKTKPKSSKPGSTAESKQVDEPSIESIFYGN